MAYLGVLEAVRARLEGSDPFFVASLPDIGDQVLDDQTPDRGAGVNTDALVDGSLRRDSYTSIGTVRVPIHYFDATGHRWDEVYPALTFEVVGFTPRFDETTVYSRSGGDNYSITIPSSAEALTVDGELLAPSPRLVRKRDIEIPFDIMFEVRCYSKDPIESALLVKYVYNTLPPRHFLRVPHNDGTYRDWDLRFSSTFDLDKREAVRSGSPGVQREYCKVMTYSVEGYMDNTDTAVIATRVRRRNFNLTPHA